MSAPSSGGFAHRGVLHRSDHHLVEEVAPALVAALGRGHRVVVVCGRAQTAALRERLAPYGGERLDVRSPLTVPAHESEAFTAWLHALAPDTGRAVVLARFRAGTASSAEPADPGCVEHRADLPVTLLCACPHDAGHDELEAFRRAHARSSRPGTEPLARHGRVASGGDVRELRATFDDIAHLHLVRARVAAAAADAGFDAPECGRAVLAVHEASVLACRLMAADVADGRPSALRPTRSCELVATVEGRRLVADIHLPDRIGFPPAMLDEDPLRWVRTFSDETSWSGTARTRRLRVVLDGSVGHDAP